MLLDFLTFDYYCTIKADSQLCSHLVMTCMCEMDHYRHKCDRQNVHNIG